MKIVLLCTFEDHTAGGILTLGRGEALARLGHDVTILYHPFKYRQFRSPAVSEKNRVSVNYLYSKLFEGGLPGLLRVPAYLLVETPRVLRLLKNSDFAIIHKPLPLSFFFLVLLKISLYRGKISIVHSDWEGVGGYADFNYGNKYFKKMLTTFCEERAPYLSDITWCASKVLLNRFSVSENIRPKCIYLPCGGSTLGCKAPDFSGKEKNLIYVGTYNSERLVEFLLEIIELVIRESGDFRFILIGEGRCYPLLKKSVRGKKLNERVRLTGQIPRSDVITHLEEAQFGLVYLNHEYPETLMESARSSTKIFEYMDSGKIIIASDFGEPREMIKNNQTGFLVSNTPGDFARKITENFSENSLNEMSRRVQKDFQKNFSHDVLVKKLVDFSLKKN